MSFQKLGEVRLPFRNTQTLLPIFVSQNKLVEGQQAKGKTISEFLSTPFETRCFLSWRLVGVRTGGVWNDHVSEPEK